MKRTILGMMLGLALASCGGDGPGLAGGRDGSVDDGDEDASGGAVAETLQLLASSPQLQSDGSNTVTLTAIAKNADNQVVADVPVSFSATAGTLIVPEGVTGEQGQAIAELDTGGDPTNRTITVTATAGEVSDTVAIDVIGSTLNIQGPTSLVSQDKGVYTITLTDSGGNGIPSRTVNVSSANGNTLSAGSVDTNSNGQITVEMTGDNAGSDTLTASALPDADGNDTVTASTGISVSGDGFRFTTPGNNKEIDLDPSTQTVTVVWEKEGTPQANKTIRFATTRGQFNGAAAAVDATTNASGEASADISSTSSGFAVITATNADGTAVQRSVEFVAKNPDSVSVQSDPAVISVNETSTISAVVRNGENLVKNATVEFTLTDNTGGTLSTPSAVTDSQGRAQTVYTASSATSADNGVTVTASVVGGTNPSASTDLTVSGRALFINFGTGNTIVENDTDTHYIKDYVVMVTDASGKGVADQKVTISALPDNYRKGYFALDADGKPFAKVEAICTNEDQEPLNGILDAGEDQNAGEFPEDTLVAGGNGNGVIEPGEDLNGNGALDRDAGWGALEPGNRALVSPGTVTTDESGLAAFQLMYPQDHALWLDVVITAKATVAGTESKRSQKLTLQMSADDADNPPNYESPFGTDYLFQSNCTNEDTGTFLY